MNTVQAPDMKALCRLASFGLAVAVLGCSSNQQHSESAETAMAQAGEACQAQFPLKPGNVLANSSCLEEVENHFVRPKTPFPDLLTAQQSYRAELAAQVDEGKLTLQVARVKMDAYMTQLNNQVTARQAAVAHSGTGAPISP